MRFQSALVSAALALVLVMAVPFAAEAAQDQSCSDLGLDSWRFHTGTGSGAAASASCEAAWNDFASTQSATGEYYMRFGTKPAPWDPSVCLATYSCYTCRPYVADPVPYLPASINPGDAGDIAVGVANGVVVKIERLDSGVRGDESKPRYAVDVLTEDGKVQILVDGRTGEADRVEPGAQCSATGSCSSNGH